MATERVPETSLFDLMDCDKYTCLSRYTYWCWGKNYTLIPSPFFEPEPGKEYYLLTQGNVILEWVEVPKQGQRKNSITSQVVEFWLIEAADEKARREYRDWWEL